MFGSEYREITCPDPDMEEVRSFARDLDEPREVFDLCMSILFSPADVQRAIEHDNGDDRIASWFNDIFHTWTARLNANNAKVAVARVKRLLHITKCRFIMVHDLLVFALKFCQLDLSDTIADDTTRDNFRIQFRTDLINWVRTSNFGNGSHARCTIFKSTKKMIDQLAEFDFGRADLAFTIAKEGFPLFVNLYSW